MGERLARVARVRFSRSCLGPGWVRSWGRIRPGAVVLHPHAREQAAPALLAAVGGRVVLLEHPERGLGLPDEHALLAPGLEHLLGVLVGIAASGRPREVDLHDVEGALRQQAVAQLVVDHVVGRGDHRLERAHSPRVVAQRAEGLDLGHRAGHPIGRP